MKVKFARRKEERKTPKRDGENGDPEN